jgi:hypothetical protein
MGGCTNATFVFKFTYMYGSSGGDFEEVRECSSLPFHYPVVGLHGLSGTR